MTSRAIESNDGDRDGGFETLSNVGNGVDCNPERVTDIDCISGVSDQLPFNFLVCSFDAKLLVNARAWA